jgi:hypothetical protein
MHKKEQHAREYGRQEAGFASGLVHREKWQAGCGRYPHCEKLSIPSLLLFTTVFQRRIRE